MIDFSKETPEMLKLLNQMLKQLNQKVREEIKEKLLKDRLINLSVETPEVLKQLQKRREETKEKLLKDILVDLSLCEMYNI